MQALEEGRESEDRGLRELFGKPGCTSTPPPAWRGRSRARDPWHHSRPMARGPGQRPKGARHDEWTGGARGATISTGPGLAVSSGRCRTYEDDGSPRDRRSGSPTSSHEHGRDVLAYALRRAAGPEDAADVVAETFLIAWRRLSDIPAGAEARLWLYGVARHTLANQRRGERRRLAAGRSAARRPERHGGSRPASDRHRLAAPHRR